MGVRSEGVRHGHRRGLVGMRVCTAKNSCWYRPLSWLLWWRGGFSTCLQNWCGSNPLGRPGKWPVSGTKGHGWHSCQKSLGCLYASEIPEIWSTVLGEALEYSVLLFPTVLKIIVGTYKRRMASPPLCDGKSGSRAATDSLLPRSRLSCCLGIFSIQFSQCTSLQKNHR